MDKRNGHSANNKRSVPEGFASWPDYWKARGMPWRTEPEIDEERQRYLAERRAVTPDIGRGIYPFRDENGSIKLTRADVEWLLATHQSGGMVGPVDWHDEKQRGREGLDVSGADLSDLDASGLPLARMSYGYYPGFLIRKRQERPIVGHLERANLRVAHLEGASLTRVSLVQAHLEGANLTGAGLDGVDLRQAYLDSDTVLDGVSMFPSRVFGKTGSQLRSAMVEEAVLPWYILFFLLIGGAMVVYGITVIRTVLTSSTSLRSFLTNSQVLANVLPLVLLLVLFGSLFVYLRIRQPYSTYAQYSPLLDNVHWADTNLSVVDWGLIHLLGDEVRALQLLDAAGRRKDWHQRLKDYQAAARAYRQVAMALRAQGLNEYADAYSYRAHAMQRQVLRRQFQFFRWFGSGLLGILAGYGYRPMRTLFWYLVVIAAFAFGFSQVTNGVPLFGLTTQVCGTPPTQGCIDPLQWYEALVLSVSSFHGRGFFQPLQNPGDPVAILAAIEAVLGLFIEITFIATFTQRFFAR